MKRGIWVVLVGLAGVGALVHGWSEPVSTAPPRTTASGSRHGGTTMSKERVRQRASLPQRRWLVGRRDDQPPLEERHDEAVEPVGDEEDDGEGERDDGDGEDDDDVSIAGEQVLVARRIEDITALARAEAVDPQWAPSTERGIAEALLEHAPGATLVSATCKTTLCIVELERSPDGDREVGMSWLAELGLPRGMFVHHEAGPDQGPRTVAYLARSGHALPD